MSRKNPYDNRSPFDALDRKRRERLLLSMTVGAFWAVLPVVFIFGFWLLNDFHWQLLVAFTMTSLVAILGLGTRHLVQRGYATAGSYLFIAAWIIVIGLNGTLLGGLLPAVAPLYAILIVMAGMLLGSRGGYINAGLAALIWLVVWLVSTNQWVEPVPLMSPAVTIGLASIVIIGFLFTAYMNQLATHDLQLALKDATYNLVQANRELTKASKMKSEFTARTSHDLRTPLSAIIVFTDLALRKMYGPLNEKQEESLNRVLSSAKRLNALIDDILDLSKIEAGELEIVEENVSIDELIETVRATLEPNAQEKTLGFSFWLSPEMPHEIVGDSKRLAQILTNLVHNAIKFTDEGEVAISINPLENLASWQMTVRDTGCGIHEDHLETIFEEFWQEGSRSNTKGTGLGLAITRHLVQMMSGEIMVESKIGKGTTFRVELPLKLT